MNTCLAAVYWAALPHGLTPSFGSAWIMLGHEPRSTDELLMVYAGILAHDTSLTCAECARMMPQLSAVSIRQAMRWAGNERRLSPPGVDPIWHPRI